MSALHIPAIHMASQDASGFGRQGRSPWGLAERPLDPTDALRGLAFGVAMAVAFWLAVGLLILR